VPGIEALRLLTEIIGLYFPALQMGFLSITTIEHKRVRPDPKGNAE